MAMAITPHYYSLSSATMALQLIKQEFCQMSAARWMIIAGSSVMGIHLSGAVRRAAAAISADKINI